MNNENKKTLNLNEEIVKFVRKRLRENAIENPNDKFNILCWIDDLDSDLSKEFDDFLVSENCTNRLKTGGNIIGKGRSTFDRLIKKKKI